MQYKEALALGLKHYITGTPCKYGHTGPRLTSTRTCVECHEIYRAGWVDRNRERVNASNRASKARNAHGYNERSRVRMRAYYRKRAGIPEAPYPEPACCENCIRPLEPGKRTHLDHDHITGKFRGWLCNQCNMGLGLLGDSIGGLERAIDYLRRAEKWQPPKDLNLHLTVLETDALPLS